jgi:uncharacterized protein YndB with AHSA1/START domain
MDDLIAELERSQRYVELGAGAGHVVELRRTYATSPDDLWEACTSAERIPRWFLPVSGDLRLGGRFQLEGNAGGEIRECDPPKRLAVTWEFGGQSSIVTLELAARGDDETELVLRHEVGDDDHWATFGPGAVGVGWELALLGLGLHVTGGGSARDRGAGFMTSDAGRAFMRQSAEHWGEAHAAAGAGAEPARDAAARTRDFYAPTAA